MPDPNLFSASDDPNPNDYAILRKGSVYNIVGPYGREFGSYKSASIAGPRWEELTHTPWPYDSSAYTPGMRLWELGLIQREHVGMRKLLTHPDSPPPAASSTPPAQSQQTDRAEPETTPETPSEPAEAAAPESKPVRQPPRESATMQRTTKPVQQTLRPAQKYVPAKQDAQPPSVDETFPSKTPSRPPTPEAKPHQHRLMFQENWDDYREPIKRDTTPQQEPADNADTDSEDD
ncbi:MAG: hypothetical protein JXA10_14665 [Anaerolineae bacterium]|nr:hypothetical protein [Anaerolineae bacterium]